MLKFKYLSGITIIDNCKYSLLKLWFELMLTIKTNYKLAGINTTKNSFH